MDITPIPTVSVDSETWTRLIDLSGFSDCILVDPCCACPVTCYYDILPYIESDNFTFGFNFDVTSVKTVNLDGTEISDVTGSWKTGARQITIKGSEAPDCFSVKLNDDCCFCFAYQKASDCGIGTLLIESTYSDVDCHGNQYSGGYSNAIRIYGQMIHDGSAAENTEDEDGNSVSMKIREIYLVDMLKQLRERGFPILHLTKVVLRGADVTVTESDGTATEFDIFTDTVNRETNTGYWLPSFELQTKPCELDFGCE